MGEFKCILIAPNGIREVSPIGLKNLKKQAKMDDGPIFYYVTSIVGTLTFITDDYHHLLTWEKSNKRCEKATLIIQEYVNGNFVELFRFIISPDHIKWNQELCSCNVEVDVKDNRFYQYDLIKDVEYNLFDLASHSITWNMDTPPASPPTNIWTVNNAMYLFDAIEGILEQGYGSGVKVKSKFFGWNDTQSYTLGHSAMLTDIIIGHNSDIYARPFYAPSGSPATIMMANLSSILNTICYMFNLKCDFEGGALRIEHISWFDTVSSTSIDVTTGNNLQLNDGRLKNYEYDNENRYSAENFDPYINQDGGPVYAIGAPIIYDTCNSNNKSIFNLKSLFTPTIKYGASFVPGMDISEGMYIVALDGSNIPQQIVTGVFNSPLHWGFLREDYHSTHKSYAKGTAFDTATTSVLPTTFGVKPFIVQRSIKVSDCNNQLSLLNANVTSLIGTGKVKKFTKQLGETFGEVDVYFNSATPTALFTPTAVADDYTYSHFTTIIFDTVAQAEPSLLANDTPGTAVVYAETKLTKALGTVVIHANGHFVYTPSSGYTGKDEFDYYIINNGLVSTATCTINIL